MDGWIQVFACLDISSVILFRFCFVCFIFFNQCSFIIISCVCCFFFIQLIWWKEPYCRRNAFVCVYELRAINFTIYTFINRIASYWLWNWRLLKKKKKQKKNQRLSNHMDHHRYRSRENLCVWSSKLFFFLKKKTKSFWARIIIIYWTFVANCRTRLPLSSHYKMEMRAIYRLCVCVCACGYKLIYPCEFNQSIYYASISIALFYHRIWCLIKWIRALFALTHIRVCAIFFLLFSSFACTHLLVCFIYLIARVHTNKYPWLFFLFMLQHTLTTKWNASSSFAAVDVVDVVVVNDMEMKLMMMMMICVINKCKKHTLYSHYKMAVWMLACVCVYCDVSLMEMRVICKEIKTKPHSTMPTTTITTMLLYMRKSCNMCKIDTHTHTHTMRFCSTHALALPRSLIASLSSWSSLRSNCC